MSTTTMSVKLQAANTRPVDVLPLAPAPASTPAPPTAAAPAHPQGVLHLNNLLQRVAKHGATRWVDRANGPQNELTWTSRLYIDDVEYGERSGRTKQIARDLAAEDAYITLSREYGLTTNN